MHRRLIVVAVLSGGTPALADGTDEAAPVAGTTTATTPTVGNALADQQIGAELGIAIGGRVTAGGLRIGGHYLYQLAEHDWFDGTASFTFGGGDAECFRDRDDVLVCDHGLADGAALELAAGIRRTLAEQGAFQPFARAALGLAYVRFSDDEIGGVAVPLHLGGGVRATVAPGVAVVGQGELTVGLGSFGRGLGAEPQLGLAVTAGAEFRLR